MSTILVVDDSAVDRRLVGGLLERDGEWKVHYAIHGADALEKLRHTEYDLVVTDLVMPGIDGLELVAAVRSQYPHVPVILMTSKGSEEIAVRALEQRDTWLPEIQTRIAEALGVTRDWIAGEELMEWVEPRGGVVGFPRIRPDAPVDVDAFYRLLTDEFGTYVGPGHWFEQSRRHFRLGFGWPLPEELKEGLTGISGALRAALQM